MSESPEVIRWFVFSMLQQGESESIAPKRLADSVELGFHNAPFQLSVLRPLLGSGQYRNIVRVGPSLDCTVMIGYDIVSTA
jgi:hypothetical protein